MNFLEKEQPSFAVRWQRLDIIYDFFTLTLILLKNVFFFKKCFLSITTVILRLILRGQGAREQLGSTHRDLGRKTLDNTLVRVPEDRVLIGLDFDRRI